VKQSVDRSERIEDSESRGVARGVRGCGPHRAALGWGGNRAKLVKNDTCTIHDPCLLAYVLVRVRVRLIRKRKLIGKIVHVFCI